MSTPPTTNVKVTLIQSTPTSPLSLFVSEAEILIEQSTLGRAIIWTLQDMPAEFHFPSDNLLHHAFVFPDKQPKPGTFSRPELGKRHFKIHALNENGSDPGPFIYQLCVTDENICYTTILDLDPGRPGTNTNPKIRNR